MTVIIREEVADRKQVIFDLWLAGKTERDIADKLCIGRNAVHESIALHRKIKAQQLCEEAPPIYNVWIFAQCDPRFSERVSLRP
jgi:hypothetical protein